MTIQDNRDRGHDEHPLCDAGTCPLPAIFRRHPGDRKLSPVRGSTFTLKFFLVSGGWVSGCPFFVLFTLPFSKNPAESAFGAVQSLHFGHPGLGL